MRLNKWLVQQGKADSRRAADAIIEQGRVMVNGRAAEIGTQISDADEVLLDGEVVAHTHAPHRTILYYKPRGVVSSHHQQGSDETIFSSLPHDFRTLKMIGRLDKMSEGLVILTSDGDIVQSLSHPSYEVNRSYEVRLDSAISPDDLVRLTGPGVNLDDGTSRFDDIVPLSDHKYRISLHEGRNHQIRRTLGALNYTVYSLKRTEHGPYRLDTMKPGEWREV